MDFNLILQYASYVMSALGIVVTAVLAVLSKLRGNKNKLFKILNYVSSFTRLANVYFGSKTGLAKKAWVLSKIQALCAQDNVNYDESFFSDYIEYILSSDKNNKEVLKNETDESSPRERSKSFLPYRKQD